MENKLAYRGVLKKRGPLRSITQEANENQVSFPSTAPKECKRFLTTVIELADLS